jgi:hypothetical protein
MVATSFDQHEGINYMNTFSLVDKMNPVQIFDALAANFGWEVHQMDVKSTFLDRDVIEDIYFEKPFGFVQENNILCELKNSLYLD